MSTPTPGHPHHPNSASKRANAHVSTPSQHNWTSPAPRSVPSPAATRKDQAGKTPLNHPTASSSQGSKTIGGTPIGPSFNYGGNNASNTSPNGHMMSFGTPVGLGMDGLTPSQLNMSTPAMGGAQMAMTMSELGMTSSGGQKRNEDEERKARMRKVLRSIGRPKGRVSEEGIVRVGKRIGFTPDLSSTGGDGRMISLAGPKNLLIDIEVRNQALQNVEVSIYTENHGLKQQLVPMADVLLKDLQVNGSSLESKLEKFAANADRLVYLDRLSLEGINCFEALSGIYTSLNRLYEAELKHTKQHEVMRSRSGRPTVHSGSRIGPRLEYWSSGPASSLNSNEGNDEELDDTVHRIHLGAETCAADIYPSLRVSDNWLPETLDSSSTEIGQALPWQDPPQTFVAPNDNDDGLVDNSQKLPNARFTAKLNPPVVLPWQVASTLLQSFGLPAPQAFLLPPAWHRTIVYPADTVLYNDPAASAPISVDNVTLSPPKSAEDDVEVVHRLTLDIVKAPDPAYKLEDLAFTHPRQLVEALPTLRQWVCISSLLKSVFAQEDDSPHDQSSKPELQNPKGNIAFSNAGPISLSDLLTPPSTPPKTDATNMVPVNVTLTTSPVPTLTISFPEDPARVLRNVSVEVLSNAELVVTCEDRIGVGSEEPTTTQSAKNKKMAEALKVCGDLGVWIEWLRQQHS